MSSSYDGFTFTRRRLVRYPRVLVEHEKGDRFARALGSTPPVRT